MTQVEGASVALITSALLSQQASTEKAPRLQSKQTPNTYLTWGYKSKMSTSPSILLRNLPLLPLPVLAIKHFTNPSNWYI
jgi:hypothetical protein